MNISKIALALGLTLGLGACGGVSKDDARLGYAVAQGMAQSAATQARSGAGQTLRGTETLPNFCQGGGSVEFTFGGTAESLNASFAFNQCNFGGVVFDGSWTITGSVQSTHVVGGLSLEHPQFSFSCDFDLTVDASGTVSGTACGYDVAELSAAS